MAYIFFSSRLVYVYVAMHLWATVVASPILWCADPQRLTIAWNRKFSHLDFKFKVSFISSLYVQKIAVFVRLAKANRCNAVKQVNTICIKCTFIIEWLFVCQVD